MKKIKGSLSAIRMSHLVIFFAVVAVGATGLRTYQLLSGSVNQETGLYDVVDFTVPLLYGLLAVSGVLFLVLSFLSKNVPAPKLPEGRNIPLGLASIIAVAGFVFDVMIILRDILPGMGNVGANNVMNQAAYDNLLVIFTKGNGGLFVILELVFAVLSALYMLVFALSHFEGKATYKKISLLSIAPGCWAMVVLISKLMKAVSFITVSELLFEIAMLVFAMLFFLTFARISSGVFTEDSMWGIYGYGLSACLFAGLVTIPRLVAMFSGLEPVEGHDFSLAHLSILVFIFSYIIASLGVGFKDGISNRKTVTEIDLPDEDIVISKGEGSVFIAEVDEISEAEDDAEYFFAEESSYTDEELIDAVADKRAEKAKSFFEGIDEDVAEEAVEEIAVEEIAVEAPAEVIEEVIVVEEAQEEPVIEAVEVVEEASVAVAEEDEPVQIIEDEKPRRPFGRRKEETEPEVIKPISLADMRKNKEE